MFYILIRGNMPGAHFMSRNCHCQITDLTERPDALSGTLRIIPPYICAYIGKDRHPYWPCLKLNVQACVSSASTSAGCSLGPRQSLYHRHNHSMCDDSRDIYDDSEWSEGVTMVFARAQLWRRGLERDSVRNGARFCAVAWWLRGRAQSD